MTQKLLPDLFLDRPLRQFPRLVQSLFPSTFANFFDEDFLPQEFGANGVRIFEEGKNLIVEVPLPGLDLKEIEVSLNKGVLLISGEKKEEEEDKKKKIYRSSKRRYSYSLALPAQIDEKQEPQAVYVDGILKLTLLLAKNAETKKIAVKAGKSKS